MYFPEDASDADGEMVALEDATDLSTSPAREVNRPPGDRDTATEDAAFDHPSKPPAE